MAYSFGSEILENARKCATPTDEPGRLRIARRVKLTGMGNLLVSDGHGHPTNWISRYMYENQVCSFQDPLTSYTQITLCYTYIYIHIQLCQHI